MSKMSPRGIVLALALVLLAASVPAMSADCCAPGAPAQQAIRAADCCATMLECPTPRVLSAVVQMADPARRARVLTADSVEAFDMSPRLSRLDASESALGPRFGAPPLYRLHAQLLI